MPKSPTIQTMQTSLLLMCSLKPLNYVLIFNVFTVLLDFYLLTKMSYLQSIEHLPAKSLNPSFYAGKNQLLTVVKLFNPVFFF